MEAEAYVRVGLVGLVFFAGSLGTRAQDATPQAAPAKAASGCSGFMCLFSSHSDKAPTPPPAQLPQAAPTPISAPMQLPQGALPAADEVSTDVSTQKVRSRVHRAAKHIPSVTIAADAVELPKLKSLTAVLPKAKIKLVRTDLARSKGDAGADFIVSTAFGGTSSTARNRLFTEQLHVVAGAATHSIADLKGKVVSFGPANGATAVAARKAFDALGVAVQETPLQFDNAFDGLATGDVDAVVMLAPQPAERLNALRSPGLHLVSWPNDAALPNGANATAITGSSYPRLIKSGETVRAVEIGAVLTMQAKAARRSEAKNFLAALSQHPMAMAKRGILKARLEDEAGRHIASAGDAR